MAFALKTTQRHISTLKSKIKIMNGRWNYENAVRKPGKYIQDNQIIILEEKNGQND